MGVDVEARDMIATLSRTLENLAERQGALILRETQRTTVSNRIVQAIAIVAARDSDDAVRYFENLKAIALDPVDDELTDIKMELEKAFAFLQATALKGV